ncbi:hypothetical protein Chor_014975, partial [Crotalus horridus]
VLTSFCFGGSSQVPGDQGQASGVSDHRRFANKHSRRALKASLTLGILLGMFFVAWLPFFVCNMAQAVCNCISADFFDILTWLGYCNSTANPIIYPLFMRDFKRAMAKYLPCCPRTWERRPSHVSLSLRNSNSGPRPGVSLRNALSLPGETDSADSIIHGNDASDQTLGFLPATRANSLRLSQAEQMPEPKLNLIYLNSPSD